MSAARKFNTQWFKDKCRAVNITQRRVAKTLHCDPATVTAIFKGERKLQMDEAVQLAGLFGVGLDEVLAAAGILIGGVSQGKGSLEISGWIDSEGMVHMGGVKGPKSAPVPLSGMVKGLVALRYQTSGVGPYGSLDGALIYYVKNATVPPDYLGRLCVVGVEGGKDYVATVKRGYGAGNYNLVDMSGRVILEGIALKWASAVVWMKL